MLKFFRKRKRHLKPRVFAMLAVLLLAVFASVFLSFNLFIYRYIRSNVAMQLDEMANRPASFQSWQQEGQYWQSKKRDRIGTRGEVFEISSDYKVKNLNELESRETSDELYLIADYLKQSKADLNKLRYMNVITSEGEYFVSSVKDAMKPGLFFVYFISVSGINNLVSAINMAMAVILAAAMLVCFVIANMITDSVTKPLKRLSAFADEIGKGNFKRHAFDFSDIEFDELGEVMNQSAEKLESYDKDQRTFFQNASHELRTPLQSIRCFAEGLQYGLMDPVASGSTIVLETDRLAELVEDLLYISRVDSITSHLEKSENDLRDTLALSAEPQKSLATKKGVEFEYRFDEAPVIFSYSEKHMYRAFSNLISNAIRYAKSKVALCCHNTEHGAEVSIIDDGPGISPEELPHIFERFYKGQGGKHGIGLSIVKTVVELHEGSIKAETNGLTNFTITFLKKPQTRL